MFQTIKGYWENGNIVLEEQPKIHLQVHEKIPVLVTFIEDQMAYKILVV